VDLIDLLVEQRIAKAIEDGVFDELPGAGKPLDLDDDRLVPEDVRVAYRILKNAGYIPPEVEQRREAADLRRLLSLATGDEAAERRARIRLALLDSALEARGGSLLTASTYGAEVVERFIGG
jgi:hypothetical protein